jgi:predicted acetyltransferase
MSRRSSPQFELILASRDQEAVLANLLQLYIYDFSELLGLDPGADGRFAYPHLPLYWSDPGRYAFLVKVDGELAGFVLVKTGSGWDVLDMAEFFVMRRYRRSGLGTSIAHEVWRRLPGPWEVRVMEANVAARHFWEHAISSFTGLPAVPTRVEQDGKAWQLFSFESSSEE